MNRSSIYFPNTLSIFRRDSLFIAHLASAISCINQLRFWKKRTAKTTTITSTAISTQLVSVTPRPPTSIADYGDAEN